ncbi:AMP-binding protein [Roseobacteraceae bacterium S113]
MTILERVYAHAHALPSKAALVEGGHRLTYSELSAKTDALAAYILRHAPDDKDVIACIKTTMTTTLLVGLACLRAGRAFTVLDARDSAERHRTVFNQAQAKMLLLDDAVSEEAVSAFGLPIHPLSQAFDSPLPDHWPEVPASRLSYIEPTSGSTGRPKLVAITQKTLNHYSVLQAQLGELSSQDVVALCGEMWFDTLLSGLSVGATLTAYDIRAKGTADMPDWMRSENVSVIQTFVAAFRALADASTAQLPDLRLVKVAGEVVQKSDVTAFEALCPPQARLINYYGSTECSLITAYTHLHGADLPDTAGLPVGQPVPGTEIVLLDDNDAPAPFGSKGRLIVKARHMADGYYRAPDRSKNVYWTEDDGRHVLNTGDIGQLGAFGELSIVGRSDDQVKIRGYSVRYSEVEDLVSGWPEIAHVAVTSITSPHGTRQLVCHYVPAPHAEISSAEIRTRLRQTAPAYMVPSYVLAHQDMPRTDTGKILRRALPNPLDLPTIDEGSAPLALTDTEAQIASVWQDVLGHSNFSREDDFFDIGGESLQAMAVVIRLERRFPVRVGYESLIMDGATIEAMAERVDAALVLKDPPATMTLKEGGARRPVYLLPVENGEFSDWLYMLNAAAPTRDYVGVHARDITQRSHFPRQSAEDLGRHAAHALIAQDPDGPYILAGYSAGTQLAMETARALRGLGREVAGLILLDPTITHEEPLARSWHIRRILSPLFKRGALKQTLNRAGHILFGRPAHELDIADETIFWSYAPEPLMGIPIVLGRAFEDKADPQAYLEYWQGILGPQISVWDLPGHHNRITRDPFAAPLAVRFEAWVRQQLGEEDVAKKIEAQAHFEVADRATAS